MSLTRFLKGKKTYLGAIAWGVLGIAMSQQWIDEKTATLFGGLILGWSQMSIRSAIKEVKP